MNEAILFTNQTTGKNVFIEQAEMMLRTDTTIRNYKKIKREYYSPFQKSINTASDSNNRTKPLVAVLILKR